MALDSLTDRDRAILDLESRWWATSGGKDTVITELGFTPVRYYQRLNQLIESEAALLYNSVVVNRLSRLRAKDLRHDIRRSLC